eukprot:EC726458.1.p1 GENE.EC726458.1~~EC726458.1.p1  ORF type:complete len:121 (+),score=15.78 EC726458.1:44-406(+)
MSAVPVLIRPGAQQAQSYLPENIISGKPTNQLESVFTSRSGAVNCGVWSSEVGKWSFEQHDYEEFCVLLQGEAILTTVDGKSSRFVTGDAFVIPSGFKGTWETVRPVKKYYCVGYHKAKL